MSNTVTIKFTRKAAYEQGLLICECGYPKNNHFDSGKGKCAHTEKCDGYKEKARYGKIVK